MKDKYEITYVNNNVIGQFIDGKYVQLTNDKKLEIFDNIKDKLETKDRRRKMFSLVIGITLAMCAIILAFLMITKVVSLGSSQWYTYTIIIAGLVLLWVLLYYLFGLVFYSKLEIDIHFKGSGNFADNYAKSNYAKWVNRYKEYLGLTTFSLKDKKKSVVSFGLCTPSTFKNIIFNGKIASNVPYYYMTYKGHMMIFMPSFVAIISKDDTMVIESSKIKVDYDNNNYVIYNEKTPLLEFESQNKFDVNFFYFGYDY